MTLRPLTSPLLTPQRRRIRGLLALAIPLALCLLGCHAAPAQPTDTYQVVHAFPHDQQAFTQGLLYLDGHLYESTGIRGQSSLRMEDLESGRILKFQMVPDKYFAEGLTNWGSTLIQLTWESHTALVYDRAHHRSSATRSNRGPRLALSRRAWMVIFFRPSRWTRMAVTTSGADAPRAIVSACRLATLATATSGPDRSAGLRRLHGGHVRTR